MGKRKHGFNSDARSNNQVVIDNSSLSQLKVDDAILQDNACGEDTPLILPSKKRKTTKLQQQPASQKRVLSKKERRKLQSVVDRKKKKEKRADILEALGKVQVPESELKFMTSTQDMHHKKSKKTNTRKAKIASDTPTSTSAVNSVKGAFKQPKNSQTQVTDSDSSDCEITSEEDVEDVDAAEDEGNVDADEANTSRAEECTTTDNYLSADDSAAARSHNDPSTKPKAATEGNTPSSSLLTQLKGGLVVQRDEEIQISRMKLPILGEEQQIIETISENQVTIICGETGSGKTTQVPQFLYEAGYTGDGFMIGITEPRRVAAISMSKRVARELNLTESDVSYQIRYEGNVTPNTCIKFMTDGVLLKEIQNNFMLDKYRAIIIDEAHERSVYTDVLIGLLTRIVSLRHKRGKPLKMVIMSATLRVEDFRDNPVLFPTPPPVLKVESRQYPVTIHFNKRTEDDYLTETFRKICKIHRQLPAGGILVFVTGKQEIHTLCRKLQRIFPSSKPKLTETQSKDDASVESLSDTESATQETSKHSTGASEQTVEQSTADTSALEEKLPNIQLDSYSALPMDEQAELEPDDSDMDTEDEEEEEEGPTDKVFDYEQKRADMLLPLHVLPLYSLLNTKKQAQVFQPPPEGCRLCVISTNVAETSLTIPNIKYVIDCGKTKNKFYDKVTGVSTFRVTFTSQASANQRAGRAGRTGPGHCYRLYSSSVFSNEFDKFSEPEIVSRPVDDLVLLMNAMGIERIINFPFPTPPSQESLMAAQDLLIKLGAVEQIKSTSKKLKGQHPGIRIMPLGKVMSLFPVAPRYARMLSMAHQKGLLEYIIAIVSACSVQELFMEGSLSESEDSPGFAAKLQKQKIQWAGKGQSLLLGDVMISLKAVGTVEYAGCNPTQCERLGLRYKAIMEIRKLRVQLTNIVNSVLPHAGVSVNPKMVPPTENQVKLIRQILLVGLGDHIARLNVVPNDAEPDVKKRMRNSYQTTLVDDYCYIHPNSVLNKKNTEYIIYQDIVEANNKIYLRGVTAIESEWIPKYVGPRCKFSEPLESPEPRLAPDSGTVVCHISSTFGPHSWMMPKVELPYPNKIEKYRWFAKSLLEGLVVKKMKPLVPKYLAAPSIMTKSWARLQPRTESLLQALYEKRICTRDSLTAAWATNPNYLLGEMRQWLPKSEHGTLVDMWPPVRQQIEDS